jgi:hypothetical protein
MSEATRTEIEVADDVDLENDVEERQSSYIARIADIKLIRINGRLNLSVSWEPLSFKQVFDRATYPFRKDDYTTDNLRADTQDGRLIDSRGTWGAGLPFGKVKNAIEDLTGTKLTKNDVFRPVLTGRIFQVENHREPWLDRDGNQRMKNNGRPGFDYYTLPVQEEPEYVQPADVRTITYPRQQAGTTSNGTNGHFEPTAEQIDALKAELNGKAEAEYVDAVLFGGNETINVEPFVSEAADPARLTERLVALGGKVVNGKIHFKAEA